MEVCKVNIEKKTNANKAYRRVIHTLPKMQVVVMNIPVGSDIKMEKHKNTSQFIRVEKGTARAIVEGKKYKLTAGDSIIIPPGMYHQVINKGKVPLKLYTIYNNMEHRSDLVQMNRPDDSVNE